MVILKFDARDTDNIQKSVRKAFEETTWFGYQQTAADHTVSWGVRVDTLKRQKDGSYQRRPLDSKHVRDLLSSRNNLTVTHDGENTLRCIYREKAAKQLRNQTAPQTPKVRYKGRRATKGLNAA